MTRLDYALGCLSLLSGRQSRLLRRSKHESPQPKNTAPSSLLYSPANSRNACCEGLETRTLLTTVVVNTVADQVDTAGSPTLSLRDAFIQAATQSSDSTFKITFSPTVFSTPKTINLTNGALSIDFGSTGGEVEDFTLQGPAAGVTINAGGHSAALSLIGIPTISLSKFSITGSTGTGINILGPVFGSDATISNISVTGSAGAGLIVTDPADLNTSVSATNCSFINNKLDGVDSPGAFLVDSTVSGNSGWGVNTGTGGAQGYGSLAYLTGSTVSGNKLGGVTSDVVVATNSTISGNLGFAIQYHNFVAPTDTDTAADADGTLTNDTIASNKGGIDASKIPDSSDGFIGLGGDSTGPYVTIANTIIAGNTTSTSPTDVTGAIFSSGHNLVGIASGKNNLNGVGGWVSSDLVGTAAAPKNPQLSALGNYGGPTFTMLPAAASPVVNAGSNALIPTGVVTDQRGNARTFGGTVDIGAVEVRYCTITGMIFNDLNKNGSHNTGEPGLSGQKVFLDLNNNGKEDPSEPYAITTSGGTYTITNIPAATYHLDWVPTAGFSTIYPASGIHSVTVNTGQTAVDETFALNVKTKLTGTTIGTAGSYNNQGNTINKATDGNLNTFFDGPVASGDWVGLDLGSAKTITQIAYAPRAGFAYRMVGGEFQISTSANFTTGVTTLAKITTEPTTGTLTVLNLTSSVTARYIRYLTPTNGQGNISEFQVFS